MFLKFVIRALLLYYSAPSTCKSWVLIFAFSQKYRSISVYSKEIDVFYFKKWETFPNNEVDEWFSAKEPSSFRILNSIITHKQGRQAYADRPSYSFHPTEPYKLLPCFLKLAQTFRKRRRGCVLDRKMLSSSPSSNDLLPKFYFSA